MTKLDDKAAKYSELIRTVFEANDILSALDLTEHPAGVLEEAMRGALNSRTLKFRKGLPPLKDSDPFITNHARVLWTWLQFLTGRNNTVHSIMYHCLGWEHAQYLKTVAELLAGKYPQCLRESQ